MAGKKALETKEKISRLSQAELGYVAGLIDGEGYIGLRMQRASNSPAGKLTIANTDPRIMTWLRSKLGGSVYRAGYPASEAHKQLFNWQLVSRQAQELLSAISPLLIIKREQAETYVAFFSSYSRTAFWTSPESVEKINSAIGSLKEEKTKRHVFGEEVARVA